jgi:hypothetical protein
MKGFILLFALLLITIRAAAPDRVVLVILAPPVFNYYESLCRAVGQVESGGDTLAYNPEEQAAGYLQVRPIRLRDYAQRTGIRYTLADMYDYHKAREVFLYYSYNKSYDEAARCWNGGQNGMRIESTKAYFLKVQKVLASL